MILWTTRDRIPGGECAPHVRLDLSEVETFLILKYKTGSEAFLLAVDPETGLPRFVTIREAMVGTSIHCAELEELRRTEQEVRKNAESLRTFLLLAAVASGCEGGAPAP
ncbi:MAG: hypothetical protein HYR98_04175 [Nitrospirae bacterium]|nr:hypothetical protein [Nitrospirota bacterium]